MAEPNRKVTYEGVASTAAAIMAALAWRKGVSSNGGTVFPPELMDLLTAMAADLSDIDLSLLPQVLAAIQGITSGGGGTFQGWPPNADYPYTGQIAFAAAFTPAQLPLAYVPDDFNLLVKAHPNNPVGSLVLVASNPADATNVNSGWPLQPNESIAYRIKQTDAIFASASVAPGCALCWTVELRR